jgi:hypothetical protein
MLFSEPYTIVSTPRISVFGHSAFGENQRRVVAGRNPAGSLTQPKDRPGSEQRLRTRALTAEARGSYAQEAEPLQDSCGGSSHATNQSGDY